jgi:hypothetical protein
MGNCCGSTATKPSVSETTPTPPPGPAETTQTNHQASGSSSDVSYQKSSVVSSSHGSNEKLRQKHAHATVQDNRGTVSTSTYSPKPRALTPSRALSQDWQSSQRHHNGIGNLPLWGDVLASQDLHHQETSPHGTPSGRIKRMNSENVFVNGRTPQFGQFLTPGAMSVEGQEDRPRFPSTLQSLLSNDFRYAVGRCPISSLLLSSIVYRFRILVVGKVRATYQTDPRHN